MQLSISFMNDISVRKFRRDYGNLDPIIYMFHHCHVLRTWWLDKPNYDAESIYQIATNEYLSEIDKNNAQTLINLFERYGFIENGSIGDSEFFVFTLFEKYQTALIRTWKQANKRNKYAQYLKSTHWRSFRIDALKHYGWKCSKCESTAEDSQLHVHHKHYKTLNKESIDDVEVLCASCHSTAHSISSHLNT